MKAYFPSKRAKILWQIRIVAVGAVLLVVAHLVRYALPYLLAIKLAIIIAVSAALVYLALYLKSFRLLLCENALIIESGVLIKHERFLPYPRLLYTEQRTTPLAERLGVSSLVLHATHTAIFTPEFQKADICEILEVLGSDEKN